MKANQVNVAFREFILAMGVAAGIPACPVIPGYSNRTARPKGPEYVIYTPIMQTLISRKAHFWLVDSVRVTNDTAFNEMDGYLVPKAIPEGEDNPFFEMDEEGYLVPKQGLVAPSAPGDSAFTLEADGYLVPGGTPNASQWIVGNIQQFTYQVDAWGPTAHARMSRLKNLFEDAIGYEFFRERYNDFFGGIGIVGASEVRNLSAPTGTSDYEHRYSADFKITATIEAEFTYQGIDAVDFELIKVD